MAKAATEKKSEDKKNTAMLEVPLSEPLEKHYITIHAKLHLTDDQAQTLRRVQNALDAVGATVKTRYQTAKHVDSPALTVAWMLENLKE